MAEQAVDLRSALAVWTRHRVLLGLAGLLGAAAGIGLAQVVPPEYESTSQVLLPIANTESDESGERDRETQVEIATSDVVLEPAGRAVSPPLSPAEVEDMVTVDAPSDDVLAFRVEADSPARARAIAQALARAQEEYSNGTAGSLDRSREAALAERQQTLQQSLAAVTKEIDTTRARAATADPTSPAARADAAALADLTAQQANLALQLDAIKDQLMGDRSTDTARVIQRATPATTLSPPVRYGLYAAGGGFAGAFLTGILLVVAARRDRRLRSRDEIADAVGCSVVTSVRSRRPRSVLAWSRLLASYSPDTVDAWALRRMLHLVRPAAPAAGSGSPPASTRAAVVMVTLADDGGALAMAPQLASYAAANGIVTRLRLHLRNDSAAALSAAAAREDADAPGVREGLLVGDEPGEAELTVALVVLDRKRPIADDLVAAIAETRDIPVTSTLLAVAAGAATAQELARAVVLMDDHGMRLDAVVVADPDDLDRTTGRVAVGGAPPHLSVTGLPSRLAGVPSARSGSERSHR